MRLTPTLPVLQSSPIFPSYGNPTPAYDPAYFLFLDAQYDDEKKRGISTGFLGFDLATQTATFYDDGTTPSHMSNLSTVGHAITSALKNLPDQTTNKYIFISDFMPTQRDILAALEKATAGGVKWRITSRRSVAETKKEGEDKLGRGDWSGLGDMIVAAQYVGDVPEADYAKSHGLWNERLGLPVLDLQTEIEKLVRKG